MSAEDMQPTRMEAAKAAAREFVERQPANVQIGVVAFSDGGIAVQPPTKDQEAILAAIDRLAPQRGTSLGSGILASLNAIAIERGEIPVTGDSLTPVPTPTPVPYGTYIPAAIVLLTDGENTTNQDPIEAARDAADLGVRVYTIGVGSAAGTTLTVNDFTVFTQLNEPMLQQIASLTDGAYYNAESEEDLREIYRKPGCAGGGQAGKDGDHLDSYGHQYFAHAAGRRIFAGVVQPFAMIFLIKILIATAKVCKNAKNFSLAASKHSGVLGIVAIRKSIIIVVILEVQDEFALARISAFTGAHPYHHRSLHLDAATAAALRSALLEPVPGARGAPATITLAAASTDGSCSCWDLPAW